MFVIAATGFCLTADTVEVRGVWLFDRITAAKAGTKTLVIRYEATHTDRSLNRVRTYAGTVVLSKEPNQDAMVVYEQYRQNDNADRTVYLLRDKRVFEYDGTRKVLSVIRSSDDDMLRFAARHAHPVLAILDRKANPEVKANWFRSDEYYSYYRLTFPKPSYPKWTGEKDAKNWLDRCLMGQWPDGKVYLVVMSKTAGEIPAGMPRAVEYRCRDEDRIVRYDILSWQSNPKEAVDKDYFKPKPLPQGWQFSGDEDDRKLLDKLAGPADR
jgi:hypothetical protein